MNKLSEIGPRGLVIRDENGTYYAVNEDRWRGLPQYPLPGGKGFDSPKIAQLIELNVALATLTDSPAMVFVNLDRLNELPAGQGTRGPLADPASAPSPSGRTIVLKEGDALCFVPEHVWGDPIPEETTGDARVLIRRGAVLAAIPENDIPQGTFCVLINVGGLVKGTNQSSSAL